jgi:hypothetical protein
MVGVINMYHTQSILIIYCCCSPTCRIVHIRKLSIAFVVPKLIEAIRIVCDTH